jgi:CcmD family protein
MQNLVYLFAAYTIIWIALFGYLFNLSRRQQRLREEMNSLRRAMEREGAREKAETGIGD